MEELFQIIDSANAMWGVSGNIFATIAFATLIIGLIILKKRVDKKRHEEMYSKMKNTGGKTMEEIKKEIQDQFDLKSGKK